MLTKKIISILFVILLSLVATGCTAAVSPPESPDSSAEEFLEEEEDEPNPEDLDPNNPQNVETTSGELPKVIGSEDFLAAFEKNEIDKEYLENITKATTAVAMQEVTNKAAALWESQINFSFPTLESALEGDELEAAALEQTAWSNDLQISIEEIKEAAKDTGSSGTVDIAYKIMLVYRHRAAAILSTLYATTGNLEFVDTSGNAVG